MSSRESNQIELRALSLYKEKGKEGKAAGHCSQRTVTAHALQDMHADILKCFSVTIVRNL